jgi:hypothetical protein
MSELARGQAVQLELDRHGSWTARVEAVMPDRVAVSPLAPIPGDAAALPGRPVRLASPTPRGVVRVEGVIVAADRSGLLEVELTAEVELDQRRDHVRIAARIPGLVAPRDEGHPPLHTFTLDVSGGGLLLAGAGPAEVGAPVVVTVKLPDRDPLRTEGRIARRTHAGSVGLVFEGIAETERELLVRWIFERQRLERQAARER